MSVHELSTEDLEMIVEALTEVQSYGNADADELGQLKLRLLLEAEQQ